MCAMCIIGLTTECGHRRYSAACHLDRRSVSLQFPHWDSMPPPLLSAAPRAIVCARVAALGLLGTEQDGVRESRDY